MKKRKRLRVFDLIFIANFSSPEKAGIPILCNFPATKKISIFYCEITKGEIYKQLSQGPVFETCGL